MSETITLVDSSAVRPGRLADLKTAMNRLADFVASSDTRAISYEFFLSEDQQLMTVVQVHPDSESVEQQMAAARELFAGFSELLTMTSMDLYGQPSEALLEALRRKAELLGLPEGLAIHSAAAGFNHCVRQLDAPA